MKLCLQSVLALVLGFAGSVLSPASAAYTTIVDNGPSSNRVDVVFLGDGYTAADLATTVYSDHIENMLDYMFNQTQDPFPRYRNFFNVHKVDVVSNESGADIPDPDDPSQSIYRDTALDASYYWDGVTERLLYVSSSKANTAMNAALSGSGIDVDMKLVTVNETKYGGGGGSWAVYAGGNGSAPDVALHELGHSFSNLADEYYTPGTTYTGGEPSQVNVTISPTGDPWSHWIGYDDPDHPELGPVGAYEGGKYKQYGIYRPTNTSKMKSLSRAFNAVSREQIILDIFDHVDPLDDWLDDSATLVDPDELWVEAIDPAVIQIEWSVDGQLVSGATGETFDLFNYGFGTGQYEVAANAFDDTDWVRIDLIKLQQSVSWTVQFTNPIDVNADGVVDSQDLSDFILALNNPTEFTSQTGLDPNVVADTDGSGLLDIDDLDDFVTLFGSLSISADTVATQVPEPATALMFCLGAMLLLSIRSRRVRVPFQE